MFSGDTMPTNCPSSTTITDLGLVPLRIPSQASTNFSWGGDMVSSASMMAKTGVLAGCVFIASTSAGRVTRPTRVPLSSTGKSSWPV